MFPLIAVYQTIYVEEEDIKIDFQCSGKFRNLSNRDFTNKLNLSL